MRILAILISLLFSGCTLMTNDYSVVEQEDGRGDNEADAGFPDGSDFDPFVCTPAQAGASYTLLMGPSSPDKWTEVCLGEEQQYIIQQTDGQFVRWFDRCNVLGFKNVNSTIRCTSSEGYEVSIGSNGRHTTDAPEGFAHTWTLYHRDVSGYSILEPAEGCGQTECEMFSGFQLDAEHRYLVRQIDLEKVRWFDNCRLVDIGTSDLDKLICAEPEDDHDITINTAAPESSSIQTIKGSWTLFAEPIGGGAHTYLSPTRGCGSSDCQMWDSFDLDADQRYMVLQSSSANVRWFDTCSGQYDDVNNKKLRCVSNDGHFIELQTLGNETSDVAIDDGSFWSLLRWPLDAS
jgi:hypothetical protein